MGNNTIYPVYTNKNSGKDILKLVSVLLFFVLTMILLFNVHKKELEIENLKKEVLKIQLIEKEKELEYRQKLQEEQAIIEDQNRELTELKKFKMIFEKVKKISKSSMSEEEALVTAKALYHSHKNTGIDWEILASMIMVESSYRPGIISDDPSYGLMQLTYEVGKDVAKKMENKNIKKHDLLDIEKNIRYGSYYLLRQILNFSDVSDGIMAYNLGASKVADLKKKSNGKLESKYLKSVKRVYREIKD